MLTDNLNGGRNGREHVPGRESSGQQVEGLCYRLATERIVNPNFHRRAIRIGCWWPAIAERIPSPRGELTTV